jgi:modulator of drug activity B
MKKALLINGYETYKGVGQAKLNSSLIDITKNILEQKGYEVKVTVVENGYDVDEEHDKTLWADIVFVQTPIYWFSVPAKLKEYIDKVYITGYAKGTMTKGDGRTRTDSMKGYGSGGLLTDTKYMLSTTWNAPQEAFEKDNDFYDGMNTDQALIAIHKTYQFLGMKQLPSFAIYDVFKDKDKSSEVEKFQKHIKEYF